MFEREHPIKTTEKGEAIFGEPRPDNIEQLVKQQITDEAANFKKRVGLETKDKKPAQSEDNSFRPDNIDSLLADAVQSDFDQAEAMKKAIKNPTTNPKDSSNETVWKS